MAHVPQMYSLYELYFAAGLTHRCARLERRGHGAFSPVLHRSRFDRFGTHHGVVRRLADGKVEITHDRLAGTGEATVDSEFRIQHYSGARTTYNVDVTR